MFVSLPGMKVVINHIEALKKFTQQALNDSNQAINLVNLKPPWWQKWPYRIPCPSASQGWDYAICTKCCVFKADDSSNINNLMIHKKSEISTLNDPFLSLGKIRGE